MASQEPTANRSGSISFSSSATDPNATSSSSSAATAPNAASTSASDSHPINPSTESEPLNAHHRPSLDATSHGAQAMVGDTTIRRTSLSQNAPGKAGEIGENAIGALGFGGSSAERPKEDQGLGEKIAAFLGT